ncbi:Abortive infection protein [Crinalium epipsammum PCC 9333]|uniref:Abortive infection protein n=1 Tax=Crinalium epipsammum PCC 9333 TaxID=1173022 RepID=K9VYX5_9CYAN|nr:type II CAAX endopeptidase family protein [Crinalium epipsammum]AFZ13338.1 Abortive infection protein [Crinalium epipsammum PCC 9333]
MVIFNQATAKWLSSLTAYPAILKILVFFISWALLWLPILIPLGLLLRSRSAKLFTADQKLPLLASLYLIAPLIVWGASWVEGVSFLDYGLQIQDLSFLLISVGLGLGLGVIGLVVVFAVQWKLGWVNWHWENREQLFQVLLPILLLGLWISTTEELIFRGFLQNELNQDYPVWVAGAIASLIFAVTHLLWERQETLPQLPGLWLMGMVLTLARWADGGSLWLACGLHAGWIWGLTCLDTAKMISYTGKASQWLTGVSEKPLAGASGLLCLLATAIMLLILKPYFV